MASCRPVTVVVGLPNAEKDKVDLLSKVLIKRVKEVAPTFPKHGGLTIPVNEGKSQGFAYIDVESKEFDHEQLQYNVVTKALDKKNRLFFMSAESALAPLDDRTVDSELAELAQRNKNFDSSLIPALDKSDLWKWFEDKEQREMFLIRAEDQTLINFFDGATFEVQLVDDGKAARAQKKMTLDGSEPVWTRGHAFWSPNGSYVATTHTQGVRLWAGDDFRPICRLNHRNVARAMFSKDEAWMITWDGDKEPAEGAKSVMVHNIRTSISRPLPFPAGSPNGDMSWPLYSWSADARYIAYAAENRKGIVILDVETLEPVPYKDPVHGILKYIPFVNATFCWQPATTDPNSLPLLAAWVPSQNPAAPCRLSLLRVPTMEIVASRNLFSVDGQARIMWQSSGAFCGLLTQVQRNLQGRKAIQSQVEILRIQNKSVPIDSLTLEQGKILDVFWANSRSPRLAVIATSTKSNASNRALFYAATPRGVELCTSFEIPSSINYLAWSPLDTHVVMGSCSTPDSTGLLWFGKCASENQSSGTYKVTITHKDEMNKLVSMAWDPSGRFLATSVCSPVGSKHAYRIAGAAGYIIWSFQGKALYRQDMEGLNRFQWRPHPPISLTDAEKMEVRRTMAEYSGLLEAVDSQKKNQRKNEIQIEKATMRQRFFDLIEKAESHVTNLPSWKEWAQAHKEREEQTEYVERVVEECTELSQVVKPTNV